MRWYLEDVEYARRKARQKIAPVADAIADELNIGKKDNFYIVGGFVRDTMLSELSGQKNNSKDFDLIIPKRPDFEKNPNIIWKKENSLGGLKIGTKNFPEIDIFQPIANNAEIIVGKYFDFNCNAIYYSHFSKNISPSLYFYCFTSNRIIDLENYKFYHGNLETRYSPFSLVSRALKFQIQFKEKFGIETKLSLNILSLLFEMNNQTEQKMFEYTKTKVKNQELQNKIINEYKKLKYR